MGHNFHHITTYIIMKCDYEKILILIASSSIFQDKKLSNLQFLVHGNKYVTSLCN